MARMVSRLTAVKVAKVAKPGMHPDGDGLYLQVTASAAKSWIFRFRADGKRHDMGLGSFPCVSLAEARERAGAARRERLDGKNPLAARRQERTERRLKAASAMTFKAATKAYIEAHETGWRNPKHRWQWSHTLESFAFPIVGDLPVAVVDTDHILKILEPIWTSKNETASRLRGRIERVLDWARVHGHRTGENPARLKAHLDHILPKKEQVEKHYPALPYLEIPDFFKLLRKQGGFGAQALAFTILTACRSGEVRGARWDEIDGAVWTIPAERRKAKKLHRVPLSQPALEIINAMKMASPHGYVFPGAQAKPLSDMTMVRVLRRMGHADIVTHGFRSTFKDWCMETAPVEGDVDVLSEFALAHKLKDKVKASYFRSDLLDLRRPLMAAWADYALSAV